MNTIKELRKSAHMSQSKFAAYLNIPVVNIQHWEQNVSSPPAYLVSLISRVMKNDGYLREPMSALQVEAARQAEASLAIENMKITDADASIFNDMAAGKITPDEARKRVRQRYCVNG